MNIATNTVHVVLSRHSICALCESDKKWKTCKRTSVIPYVRLSMQLLNETKRTAPCSDWCECESDDWITNVTTRVVQFWIQPSDSNVQAGFPKKNRSEGERGVRNTWIPQCRIRIRIRMPHIWNLEMHDHLKGYTDRTTDFRINKHILSVDQYVQEMIRANGTCIYPPIT